MDLNGQVEIEELLRRLAPPKWPEEVLGKIDRDKAAVGEELFAENCAKCHSTWPHRWSEPKLQGKRFIENALVPHDLVGTDPMQFAATQFDPKPAYIAGRMSEFLDTPYQGANDRPGRRDHESALVEDEGQGARQAELDRRSSSRTPRASATRARPALTQPVYKAGPRDGIWATPPYLHNGSVPSLYELLSPARERPKTFFIGSEFDPVKVGVDTTGNSGKFAFDTALVGNSNAGHSFEDGPSGKGVIGRLLSDERTLGDHRIPQVDPHRRGANLPVRRPQGPGRGLGRRIVLPQHPQDRDTTANTLPSWSRRGRPRPARPRRPPSGKESVASGEAEFIEAITRQTLDRLKAQYPKGKGEVRRDAHPKTHGLVRAEFVVEDDLPEELRHGIFAEGAQRTTP